MPRRVVPAADVAGAYALDLGAGGVLLTSPLAMQDVLAALDGAIRAQRGTGVQVRPEVADLRDTLARRVDAYRDEAAQRRTRQSALPQLVKQAPWDAAEQMTVKDAAHLLGVQERQVRNLAHSGQLGGRKVGGAWLLDARAVTVAAEDRKESTR
ncbi:helix-turn-helix domain-containing protein [uncultured Modestobacter sp.]|uniref:helix-turn-helix domain-containing protein n=1 Tax=uncultured Modestobacter sp. TaxID=380048 RepID=UPI00262FF9C4|nr:helix-turn-helix domain-containing protein [uncultured Modestobacter sp.]